MSAENPAISTPPALQGGVREFLRQKKESDESASTSPSVQLPYGANLRTQQITSPSIPKPPNLGESSDAHDGDSPLMKIRQSLQNLCSKTPVILEQAQDVWSEYQLRIKNHGERLGSKNLTRSEREEIELMRMWRSRCDKKISSLVQLVEEFQSVGVQTISIDHDGHKSHSNALSTSSTGDDARLDDSFQKDSSADRDRASLFRLLGLARQRVLYLKDERANLANRINLQQALRRDPSEVDEEEESSDAEEQVRLKFYQDVCDTKLQRERKNISSLRKQLGMSSEEDDDSSPG